MYRYIPKRGAYDPLVLQSKDVVIWWNHSGRVEGVNLAQGAVFLRRQELHFAIGAMTQLLRFEAVLGASQLVQIACKVLEHRIRRETNVRCATVPFTSVVLVCRVAPSHGIRNLATWHVDQQNIHYAIVPILSDLASIEWRRWAGLALTEPLSRNLSLGTRGFQWPVTSPELISSKSAALRMQLF